MRRRPFLVGIVAAVAGCTGQDTATEDTQQFRDSFLAYLGNQEVTVVSVERSDDRIQLVYVPRGQQYEELSAEIGAISGGFLREVERGWDVSRLDADIVSENDQTLARWHVLSEWIEQYRANEITGEDLSLKVINTLEYA
jgi:hypothetical protein